MNKQLRTVLDELYALDPELRAQEEELIPILQRLLENKPDATPDEAFVQRLRVLLRDEAASAPSRTASRSIFSFFSMPSYQYAITGAVLGAVITGPVVYGIMQSGGVRSVPTDEGEAIFSYAVEDAGDRAFGDLDNAISGLEFGRGQGGGGGPPAMDSALPLATSSENATASDVEQRMMIAPGEITEYRLVFDGEMPALSDEQVEILRRQKGVSNADVGAIMRSFNTGLIDLESFGGAKADTISFYQDVPYGYMVNVSFREGMISLNANWEQWPHPEADCRDEACFRRLRLDIADVPSDDVILGIADDFVRAHGIDLAQYSEPEVDDLWRRTYEQSPDKSQLYVPDQIRVIYPLLVEGKPVYDEGGAKTGISVGVNIRENKVSDVWGIQDQKYQRSSYPAVTDASLITEYLEKQGNLYGDWLPEGATVKTVEVTLGTPEAGYVKVYSYENGRSDELIVPALLFPVTNVPAGETYYRETVAVPLASDILQKSLSQPGPRPMPVEPLMIEEDAATTRAPDEE